MKTEITTLPNKLKIITNEMPGARSITTSVLVGAGGRSEKFDREGGVSHFLEHVLFKGSTRWPSWRQISQAIDTVGGYYNAYTGNDVTGFYIKVPKQQLPLTLDILSDIIMHPFIDQAEIDRERDVIIEEVNWRRHDDPSQLVGSLLPPLLWPHDALGQDVIGNEEVIRTIGRDGILRYKNRFYHPGNIVVSVAGGVKHEQVVSILRDLLGTMAYHEVPKLKPVRGGLSEQRTTVYTKPTAQANFLIGCRAYPYWHRDDAAMNVLSTILGKGMSSRLFSNVRERKGLAYDIGSGRQNFVDTGLFEVYAAVNSEKTEEAIEAVIDELKTVQLELVPEEELSKAKSMIKGMLAMSMESNNNVSDRFGSQLLLLGKVRSLEESIAKIDAVTSKDVLRVAKEILALDNLRMAIVAADGVSAKLKFEELVS